MPREFEISTTIDGSPDEAWAVLTDLERGSSLDPSPPIKS